jgi:predicted unusual protein kinase regulating ubiquinone biosynthesis (AarF/ABC1/UbiB family)
MSFFITLAKVFYWRLRMRYFPSTAQRFWAQALLDANGLNAKVGQIFAQGGGQGQSLPQSTLSVFEAKNLFVQSFGHDEIYLNPVILSASMGQVFHAHIAGEDLALKILHPGIKQKLEKEINSLLLVAKYFAKSKGFFFDAKVFERFLKDMFEKETDLERERSNQAVLYEYFKNHSKVLLPEVIEQYSNKLILTQRWLNVNLARDLIQLDDFIVFEFFFESLLKYGYLHADLNDRNWGKLNDGKTAIFDFGSVEYISPRRRSALIKLLQGQGDLETFQSFGIKLELTSLATQSQKLRDALFSLFDQSPNLELQKNYAQTLRAEFGKSIQELRECTDPWILMFMRSLFSVIQSYNRMDVAVPFKKIIAPYLSNQQEAAVKTQLKVEVREKGEMKVFLTLPSDVLNRIHDYLPSNALEIIKQKNIQLDQLVQKAKDQNYAAQMIMELEIENKTYKIWLE